MGAIRFARETATTSVPDQQVTKQRPLFLRHQLHQVLLNFFRCPMFCEAESMRQSPDMGIDDHADVDVEGVAEDNVGSFATDNSPPFQR